ncbi:MAG: low specificity L-threonine aldolase [Rhodospirillales bacterium 70-18]|nr:MAG: low specificity L-threonine aldolase [Rhodospirillales bacterium 70-18]
MDYAPLRASADLPPLRVNLYSDTQTKPTPAMKEAMMRAEVGDEQFGLDPTVNALCDQMAALMGKEAAVFLPSGTMCNQVAILTHCRPGDEILAHETAHILTSEGGGAAALTGAQITGLRGPRGMFDAEALRAAIRPKTRYAPPQTLMEIEQTANTGGGAVWPVARMNELTAIAHENGMATHMDGARLMNAVVAAGTSARDMAAGFDSLWLDFTKGLGAPLGAVLCGSKEFIGAAWRWKQRVGGSMRQGGICAAACIYALDHHIDRLAEDHANAKLLVRGLAQIPGIKVEEPDTNLVFFDVSGTGLTSAQLADAARLHGVAFSTTGKLRVRACTHLDVTAAQIEEAVAVVRAVVAKA